MSLTAPESRPVRNVHAAQRHPGRQHLLLSLDRKRTSPGKTRGRLRRHLQEGLKIRPRINNDGIPGFGIFDSIFDKPTFSQVPTIF